MFPIANKDHFLSNTKSHAVAIATAPFIYVRLQQRVTES